MALAASKTARFSYREVAPPVPRGDRRSFGARLGTIPNYTNDKPGVLLDGVAPGSPAAAAGLEKGDRIVAIDGVEVRSVQEFAYVLQDARPGQKARITIERAGKKLSLTATYGRRGAGPASEHHPTAPSSHGR